MSYSREKLNLELVELITKLTTVLAGDSHKCDFGITVGFIGEDLKTLSERAINEHYDDQNPERTETTIEYLEGQKHTFKGERSFIAFVQRVFEENEGSGNVNPHWLKMPTMYGEARAYVNRFCDNLKIIE